MLTSLVLQLTSSDEASLPSTLGRASQALLFEQIGVRSSALAKVLDEEQGLKPYTASNLQLGQRRGKSRRVRAGDSGWLRWTGLRADVSEVLRTIAAEPPPMIQIDGHPLTVTGATLDGAAHPWAGCSDYQTLAAPFLLGTARLKPKLRLEFTSPTTFRRNKRSLPLPLPELVFGSLFNRWQTFAPLELHSEMRRFTEETVALSGHNIRSLAFPYKHGSLQIGFMGWASFTALNRDRYWLAALHLLAAFAFYSGVGYLTGVGMGQVKER